MLFTWFAIRSVLPANRGTQKLWLTSADVSLRKVASGADCGTDRDMKFVRSDNSVLRIPELPPELMADHGNVKGCLGLWCVLNCEYDSGSR